LFGYRFLTESAPFAAGYCSVNCATIVLGILIDLQSMSYVNLQFFVGIESGIIMSQMDSNYPVLAQQNGVKVTRITAAEIFLVCWLLERLNGAN
jgi:hypothetical protein